MLSAPDSQKAKLRSLLTERTMSEGASEDAARRIADMKKADMAQSAQQLLAGTGWLPAILRAPEADEQPTDAEASEAQAEDGEEFYAVAAE